MKHLPAITAMLGAALILSLIGCEKDSVSSRGGSLTLSVRAVSGSTGLPKTANPQAQQVSITSAKVVLGEIEIENSSEDSMDFKSNTPLVVNLDLTGAPTNLGSVSIPFGTYEELNYEIARLTPQDTAVYNANPDLFFCLFLNRKGTGKGWAYLKITDSKAPFLAELLSRISVT